MLPLRAEAPAEAPPAPVPLPARSRETMPGDPSRLIRPLADIEREAIERAVLRLAAYELLHRMDVPYRVVINEAIEIAKRFGSEHGHTYVNGVLDRASAQWRQAEVQAPRHSR